MSQSTGSEADIERLWERYQTGLSAEDVTADDRAVLDRFLGALEAGEVRAAEKTGDAVTSWEVNTWVKHGVLLNFALRDSQRWEYGDVGYNDVLPLRETADLQSRGTRNTPDGTVLRRGTYLGADVIVMSPAFLNIGVYVGDDTLVDSCDTVGSCAQIGEEVKLGANTLIGGVLEPIEDAPVIIEDGVSIGAGCRVTSGFRVGENTVVGENTLLTPRIPVYDLVDEEIRYGYLPANRRAFARSVRSSVSEHDLIDGDAYKPAVVATDLEETTVESTQREATLRE
ncbi:MAG: 2,3,4,5-tetrahydropyridine-2,6-dicarboxylate N-succinyltransferase [Halobacteriales archaeon]|nr:2,3,4,5-tetrahydropyridine-2,6-dicarboxylate N-succinyltransferase [Halobacteriales archaeon]